MNKHCKTLGIEKQIEIESVSIIQEFVFQMNSSKVEIAFSF